MKVADCRPGIKSHRYTVIETFYFPGNTDKQAFVKCDCGSLRTTPIHSLGKRVKSCGCFRVDNNRRWKGKKRGPNFALRNSRTYYRRANVITQNIKARCTNPNHQDYDYYGGRGIEFRFSSVDEMATYIAAEMEGCEKWCDNEYTVDRINNNGHYERGNLRWATRSEQACNRRKKGECLVK